MAKSRHRADPVSLFPQFVPPPPAIANVPMPLDERQYPALCAWIRQGVPPEVLRELTALAIAGRTQRAPRKAVLVLAHLQCEGFSEPVLIRDVSRSGVRFLIPIERGADLSAMGMASLRVEASIGATTLAVEFVRVCGRDDRRLDVAARFAQGELGDDALASLQSRFFEQRAQRKRSNLAL